MYRMENTMDKEFENFFLKLTKENAVLSSFLLQELWSGYGKILRVKTDKKSYIIKLIKFPNNSSHPKGWSSEFAHQRKVKSYQVEQNWYRFYRKNNHNIYTPQYYFSGSFNELKFLILEDLESIGYFPNKSISFSEIELCIKWLANFHATFLKREPKSLWKNGTYWHLETRPDELKKIDDNLKEAAPKIDKKLSLCPHQTILHGDAKLANFLFKDNAVAAVDFQYSGSGVGVKDLVLFLSSVYNEDELFENEKKCLDIYFRELSNKDVEEKWRELYPYAWADFYRFLKGWSPEHFKINRYSQFMTQKVLYEVK